LPIVGKVPHRSRRIKQDGHVPVRRDDDSEGDVGAAPPDYLAEIFEHVARRITRDEQPLGSQDLDDIRLAGSKAAEHGMTVGEAVDLYLVTAASAWGAQSTEGSQQAKGRAVINAIRAAVPMLVQGYHNAGQSLIQQEEANRVEIIDDLLRGDVDVASMVQRAEPFGLDLSASHQVVLAGTRGGAQLDQHDRILFKRAVNDRYGDRNVLVSSKASYIVALIPWMALGPDVDEPARRLRDDMRRSDPRRHWRFAVGRPHPGAYGFARSYQQAREAMNLAERLHPDDDMVPTRDLLIYRVLGRDRAALAELVENVLTPLTHARGGAGPLVDTLEAYFAAGEVATETARRLHVSVRTVTYRLAKVTHLTGYDPSVPTQRLTLQTAVIGARLLPWPNVEHSDPAST